MHQVMTEIEERILADFKVYLAKEYLEYRAIAL